MLRSDGDPFASLNKWPIFRRTTLCRSCIVPYCVPLPSPVLFPTKLSGGTAMRRILVVACLALSLSGCSTLDNLDRKLPMDMALCPPDNVPIVAYGGVMRDIDVIMCKSPSNMVEGELFRPVFVLAGLIDLPFSAVADTVTLPYVLLEADSDRAGNITPASRVE